jgi:hypothetical protein
MIPEVELIVQLPRDSSVDQHLREETPPSVRSGRVVVEHLAAGEDGRLAEPAEAGEIVLSVLSPEALRREPDEVRGVIRRAAGTGGPLIVRVEGAEYLREEELTAILDAAAETQRIVIMRIMEGV